MERPAKALRLNNYRDPGADPGFAPENLHPAAEPRQYDDLTDSLLDSSDTFDDELWEESYDNWMQERRFTSIISDEVYETFHGSLLNQAQKRSYQAALEEQDTIHDELPHARQYLSDYLPRIPSPVAGDKVNLDVENPFASDDGIHVHPGLQRARKAVTGDTIEVNGFIKIRILRSTPEKKKELSKVPFRHFSRLKFQKNQDDDGEDFQQKDPTGPADRVPNLPPHFGEGPKLIEMDRRLFNFFTDAVCKGRTVIGTDNTYYEQIAPMTEKSEAVKHAVLALASSYVLDYYIHEQGVQRAGLHFQRAVTLLGDELKTPENRLMGKGDALVACLILLGHNECINWEIDRRKERNPKWYRAAVLAEQILDQTNPGVAYHTPENVQLTRARAQLANRVCLDSVLSYCVYPLDGSTSKCKYNWLTLGNLRERRRVIGFTGLSSDLMHCLVRITHFCERRWKNPSSYMLLRNGGQIEKLLKDYQQWSELSEGYATAQELLDSLETCNLDENSKVTSADKVTELVAESYVAAAQIYLQCRFFRRRRDDPIVRRLLHKLLITIKYQPTSGLLFTAQTPLFSVFIGGLVAYMPEDREVICAWFDPICTGSRGNVPPAYEALKYMWGWLDDIEQARPAKGKEADLAGAGNTSRHREDGDEKKKDNSDAWWEDMVAELSSNYGRVNLA